MVRVRRCLLCESTFPGVSVFKFPKDSEIAAMWARFCGISPEAIKSTIFLCEAHFTPDCFTRSFQKNPRAVRLREGAVPSLNGNGSAAEWNGGQESLLGSAADSNVGQESLLTVIVSRNGHADRSDPIRFPRNAEKRSKWLSSLELLESELKDHFRVCSRHFIDGTPASVPVRNLVYSPLPEVVEIDDDSSSAPTVKTESEISAKWAEYAHDDANNEPDEDPLSDIQMTDIVGSPSLLEVKSEVELAAMPPLGEENTSGRNEQLLKGGATLANNAMPAEPELDDSGCTGVTSEVKLVAVPRSTSGRNEELLDRDDTQAIIASYCEVVSTPHVNGALPTEQECEDSSCTGLTSEVELVAMPCSTSGRNRTLTNIASNCDSVSTDHVDRSMPADQEREDSICTGITPKSSKKTFQHFRDFSAEDLETPQRKRQCLELGRTELSNYRALVRLLHARNDRMRKRLTKVEDTLKNLRQIGVISECAFETLKVHLSVNGSN